MIRVAYKVDFNAVPPMIIQTDTTDLNATDWRTAKKVLRGWYLAEAAALRKVSEKSYFADEAPTAE